jgi:hypothetical protein
MLLRMEAKIAGAFLLVAWHDLHRAPRWEGLELIAAAQTPSFAGHQTHVKVIFSEFCTSFGKYAITKLSVIPVPRYRNPASSSL